MIGGLHNDGVLGLGHQRHCQGVGARVGDVAGYSALVLAVKITQGDLDIAVHIARRPRNLPRGADAPGLPADGRCHFDGPPGDGEVGVTGIHNRRVVQRNNADPAGGRAYVRHSPTVVAVLNVAVAYHRLPRGARVRAQLHLAHPRNSHGVPEYSVEVPGQKVLPPVGRIYLDPGARNAEVVVVGVGYGGIVYAGHPHIAAVGARGRHGQADLASGRPGLGRFDQRLPGCLVVAADLDLHRPVQRLAGPDNVHGAPDFEHLIGRGRTQRDEALRDGEGGVAGVAGFRIVHRPHTHAAVRGPGPGHGPVVAAVVGRAGDKVRPRGTVVP